MDFFELQDIAETNIEIFSPCSAERILELGSYLKLDDSSRVIDFGCGTGELLAIWGRKLGVSGIGIDIRVSCIERAEAKISSLRLNDQIDIIHGRVSDYSLDDSSFDIAICLTSSYTWGGFAQSLASMKKAIKPGGKVVIGEPHWLSDRVKIDISSKEPFFTERELLKIARQQGFDFEFMFRASRDDLDAYESRLWRGYIDWLETNPDHPDKGHVIEHLHKIQNNYFEFDRDNFGWAIYVLKPVKYNLSPENETIISVESVSS